jgi:monovalent cation/hydrogen antiporter
MQVFETILVLLMDATILSSFARWINIPYPTVLALGGALIAFLPGAPRLNSPPELILALFVAPVLLALPTMLRSAIYGTVGILFCRSC